MQHFEAELLIAALTGLVLGFVLAMPPGPIGVTAIRYGLEEDKIKPGAQLATGTAFMDFIYCLAAIFATSAVYKSLAGFTEEHPVAMLIFQIIVVLAFVAIGIYNIKYKNNNGNGTTKIRKSRLSKYTETLMTKGPFLLGIAIALTNIANPTFLPSLAWITLYIHQQQIIVNSFYNNLIFALAFGVGNFLWLYLLIRIVMKFRPKMSPNTVTRIRQFAGVTLIGVGTLLGYRLVIFTKWSEILRFVFAF